MVDLSGTVNPGSKYSRKEHKSHSMRKACWILPLLQGQMIIWSQLGVSQSCVSLQQPALGTGSSSIYWETMWGGFSSLPFLSSFRAACACRSPRKAAMLGACMSRGGIATCEWLLHPGKSMVLALRQKHNTHKWKKLIFIGGQRHNRRASLPGVMGMHFS